MMTRRHDALIPLTHDHHHALAQARTLMTAADADAGTRAQVAESFLNFYEEDTLLHFHEEEEVLFPRLVEAVDEVPSELTQVLVEHVRIHGMVARLREATAAGEPEGDQLRHLGETLRSHVRFEENKLFPLIEDAVKETDLNALTFSERRRK
jgi:iron-sulfur cluster repair protein YtfE (RIC family)